MQRFLKRVLAKASILALMFSSLLIAAPVKAATLTDVSDTLSRQKISETGVEHTLSLTLPSMTQDNFIIFDYATAGFSSLAQSGSSGDCASGTCTLVVSATDVKITCTAGPCSGLFTQTGTWTATNPGTAGSKSVSYTSSGPESITGSFSIAIADDDQVTVTATVAEEMTFDIDTGTTTTVGDTDAPYTVALGTLTTGAVSTSGDGSINIIALEVSTNASGGAVVQVKNANGANGLTSASVGTDTIDAVATTLVAGTEGYGICVNKVETTSGTLQSENFDADVTLSATATNAVSTNCTSSVHILTTALTTTFQDILSSNGAALSAGQGEVFVKAAISSTTAAHDDYADTLTFRATATF